MRINFFSEISNFSYGVYGKNIALELNKHLEVCLAPSFHNLTGVEKNEAPEIQKMLERLAKINFNDVGVMFGNGNQMFRFCGKKRAGFTFFFSDELEETWVNQLAQLDAVCVPSKWHSEILSNYKIKSHIIPAGVNLTIFKPRPVKPLAFDNKLKFKFLSIGKWDSRKNQKLTLEAFCEEFKPEENVELYCMWANPFLQTNYLPELFSLVTNKHKIYTKENPDNSTVFILNPVTSFYQLAILYHSMHCGIFPFKAEASGLRLLECMATGMPCIATNYSAVTEFIKEQNCYLLKDYKIKPLSLDKDYKKLKGNWAEPSKEELKSRMREIYTNYTDALTKGQRAALDAKRFFWWNASNKLLSVLLSLSN